MIRKVSMLVLFVISIALVSGCGERKPERKIGDYSNMAPFWQKVFYQVDQERLSEIRNMRNVDSSYGGYRYITPTSSTNSSSKRAASNPCNCIGYSGVGGPCYDGVGGPAYAGVGGPAYAGVGGRCYAGVGGQEYSGVGGSAYSGVGGPRYSGVGGPAYDGVGGPAYSGVGGACYAGVGGPCYAGVGGGWNCPSICR